MLSRAALLLRDRNAALSPMVAVLADMLLDVASQVEGHTICGLGDAAAWPIQGLFRHFRHEVEDRITQYRAGRPHVQGVSLQAAE